jgi:DNA-binding MarR family transcriptional regulator
VTRQRTREEILRAALREAVLGSTASADRDAPGAEARDTSAGERLSGAADRVGAVNRDRERRRWLAKLQRAESLDFIRGITDTAALIQRARGAGGELVFRTDARYSLLAALERIGGWPSISELGRALGVSKQTAREQVIAAARAGLLELVPDPSDRRSIQIGLTPSGKTELAAARLSERALVASLLRGLGARDMKLVAHVLRVMRERLLRAERERALVDREPAHADGERERQSGADKTSLGRSGRG